MSSNSLTRIAIVSEDKCRPKKCRQECRRSCPVVRTGKLCIEVAPNSRIAFISETLCIGCGICVKKCPFGAINIINLPTNLEQEVTHRYAANTFKLHRLPTPRPGQVLGLVGTNGIGKSTALKVMSGKLKPNLGRYDNPPDWAEIVKYFRGSELQNFFTKVIEDNIKALIKPQYVDHIPRAIKAGDKRVGALLKARATNGNYEEVIEHMDLKHLADREVQFLSGGELQRFAIAAVATQNADVYMFDEPSSYLDIKQRLKAGHVIRSLLGTTNYVIVVEHDLSILDYLSDFVCVLYGVPSVYGVVTLPYSVREGINIFLDGNIPTENLRFRNEALSFRLADASDEVVGERTAEYNYPDHVIQQGDFKLNIGAGGFSDAEIVVLLGENGTGKTTFIKWMAKTSDLKVSMKPQTIAPKFQGTVRQLFFKKIRSAFLSAKFQTEVCKPMNIDSIIDQEVLNLSGGELQRVAICLALGMPADVYLIDEPSAYLDSEQRIIASKVIKRFIVNSRKTAFVVEHDFIMATYLADRVVLFEGEPSKIAHCNSPQSLLTGMNSFLRNLDVTFRRDPNTLRPRINKLESQMDKEQKAGGNYFFLEN
ncbi:iron-sulfur protein [Schizosaccharomyces cryophilus OY26]|uniref:Translation initiation factor RLI1 n=1 Tax=Schizosaccharomyces cryophilus (strain OY26 / ATCC MYA-4695 / CBS 11777 / NBRC 106824 / NRRL Y48691) TaxID=653667 RepID=S9VR22_SCHCR|nr:iron-sulfur protein [Schizosaccharomyces cryophilus OY26]EPY50378.1 iron-sulfur protein [Schizosaccharomyces cryophilus OY26]